MNAVRKARGDFDYPFFCYKNCSTHPGARYRIQMERVTDSYRRSTLAR